MRISPFFIYYICGSRFFELTNQSVNSTINVYIYIYIYIMSRTNQNAFCIVIFWQNGTMLCQIVEQGITKNGLELFCSLCQNVSINLIMVGQQASFSFPKYYAFIQRTKKLICEQNLGCDDQQTHHQYNPKPYALNLKYLPLYVWVIVYILQFL